MGFRHIPRAGLALTVAATFALAQQAAAFEPTGNAVADAILESMEAGGASNVSVENVVASGDQLLLQELSAEFEENGKSGSLTATTLAFSGATLATDGSVTADALAATELSMVQDDTTVEIAVAALKGVRIPSPTEAADPAKAVGKPPVYTAMQLEDVSIATEGEGTLPIETVTSSIETTGADGSVKARFAAQGVAIDPEHIDDQDTVAQLRALGYDGELSLDAELAVAWNAADGRGTLETLDITGENIGTLNVSATVGGLTPAVLAQLKANEQDTSQTMALLQQLTIEDLRVHFKNASVVERVLDQQAKQAQTDRAGLVNQISTALPNILALLRNPSFQEKVAAAATTFLRSPGTLTASAKPVQPVPMAQIMGAAMIAPQSIPDILAVEVTANE